MKKTLVAIVCVLGLLLIGINAQAATIDLVYGDAYYVGFISDGIPADPTSEMTYITNLAGLAPGAGDTIIGTETYNRVGSTITPTPPPTAFIDKDESGSNSWTATTDDPFYILGKYDGPNFGDWVWLVDGSIGDIFNLPTTGGGYGLSHISAYTTSTSVPEPTALLLLGFGLAGVAAVRRKIKK